MNSRERGIRTAVVLGMMASAAGASQAGVTLTSSLDWSQVSIQVDGADVTSLISGKTSNVFIYDPAGNTTAPGDWSSTVYLEEPSSPTTGNASGLANASAETAQINDYASLVNVNRYGEISLAGGQTVTISIPYSLSFAAVGNTAGESGSADVQVQLIQEKGDASFPVANVADSRDIVLTSPGGSSGVLDLTFQIANADTYRLAFNANAGLAVSAVPEPASVAMLLAGCLALYGAAWRRRRE